MNLHSSERFQVRPSGDAWEVFDVVVHRRAIGGPLPTRADAEARAVRLRRIVINAIIGLCERFRASRYGPAAPEKGEQA